MDLPHPQSVGAASRQLRFLSRQPVGSVLNGHHPSGLKGLGLNFEEFRYCALGDDIRNIDWTVTARTGKTLRIYTEERDRAAMLLGDQRMSMFFGSVRNLQPVTAAHAIRSFEDSEIDERLLVLLSDGADMASTMTSLNAAAIAAQEGIIIYTIGVGNIDGSGEERLAPATLQGIAERGGGATYFTDDVAGLPEIYAEIGPLNPLISDSATYQPHEPKAHIPFALALLMRLGAPALLHLTRSPEAAP